ncbi:DUF4256 domain-containing protein [Proteiniclasticum sp. QWL-01]|uniref:DUF4256 domain-containing protein n=1 Tax=Proteiniclasticum sp. QWL-01 TaxID=3036945 RepID=UPI00241138EC|nr:DUF4256 domain-containing protein [Proteiniclasticum sp. QWL-01]WFF73835.1 DUF4256 domain-containing protein [Proteiniclasticum sp. QWL-01]
MNQSELNIPIRDQELLKILEERFEQNLRRHPEMKWDEIARRLEHNPEALQTLHQMEETGGEPDVVWTEGESIVFADCSPETPSGRRNLCYDEPARKARKKNAPEASAMGVAGTMGLALLTEAEYRRLHETGPFDQKTSSWLLTPESIRSLGGALFGDYRYGTVFIYHNGADSYYGVRGFRGLLKV